LELTPLIPKKIHYCWFGNSHKPEAVQAFIRNWHEKLPGFEIIEWNEGNFNLNEYPYAEQAYREKKYAFVSDVARLHALLEHGGVYLDTDVEVKKDISPLLSGVVTLGFEEFNYIATSTLIAPAGSLLISDFLGQYRNRSFHMEDGTLDLTTNVIKLTEILTNAGLVRNGSHQVLQYQSESIRIVEQALLSPMDYPNGIDNSSADTYTVHHFGQSWVTGRALFNGKVKAVLHRIIGGSGLRFLRRVGRAFRQ
jgi:Glycosyltransferase sugar-binding region containing DXD motif